MKCGYWNLEFKLIIQVGRKLISLIKETNLMFEIIDGLHGESLNVNGAVAQIV